MTIKAFLVEDNPSIREDLTSALEELAPIEVVGFAEDELSATTWLASNPSACDLLIIDIYLKRGSGIGVLRAASALDRVTKVVTSNYSTPDIRRRCIDLGAARFFDKSTEFEQLVDYCARLDGGETGPASL